MSQIHNNLSRLLEILKAEFKLLQTDNLDGFETLQEEKQAIVEALSEKLAPADVDVDYDVADGDSDDPNEKSMLAMCRDYHIRNGILLEKGNWKKTILRNGDSLEIFSIAGGG